MKRTATWRGFSFPARLIRVSRTEGLQRPITLEVGVDLVEAEFIKIANARSP